MDYGSGKATYRLVDHFRLGVQHWFERYRPLVCNIQ